MQDEITIFLSTPEAVQFREFQKNYQVFKDFQQFHAMFALLAKKGVFDIDYGFAKLNFTNGELQNIQIERTVWKK